MQTALPTIEELISSTNCWDARPVNYLVAHTGRVESETVYQVPNSYLAQQHLLFPIALRALIAWKADPKKGWSAPHWQEVYDTLCVLVNGAISFTTVDGTEVHLSSVRTIDIDWNLRQVELFGVGITLQYTTYNGQQVPFSVDHRFRYFDVSLEELESKYPGWEENYRTTNDLGTDIQTTVQKLFFTQPNTPATITDITFF